MVTFCFPSLLRLVRNLIRRVRQQCNADFVRSSAQEQVSPIFSTLQPVPRSAGSSMCCHEICHRSPTCWVNHPAFFPAPPQRQVITVCLSRSYRLLVLTFCRSPSHKSQGIGAPFNVSSIASTQVTDASSFIPSRIPGNVIPAVLPQKMRGTGNLVPPRQTSYTMPSTQVFDIAK